MVLWSMLNDESQNKSIRKYDWVEKKSRTAALNIMCHFFHLEALPARGRMEQPIHVKDG